MFWRSKHYTLSQPASERWRLDWSVSEAPSSILYRLSNTTKHEGGYVSVTKRPLSEVHRAQFLERAKLFQSTGVPIVSYGLDSNGHGCVTWGFFAAKVILYDNPAANVRRFRYLSALLSVEVLHESDMLHGGLTASSFVVDDKNNVFLFDLVFAGGPPEEKTLSGELATYWLPEGQEAQAELARDVYALGVLGVSCFGARFVPRVLDNEAFDNGLRSLLEDAPRWVNTVVAPIVSDSKKLRIHNASGLLAAIAVDERLQSAEQSDSGHSGKVAEVSLEELVGLMQRGAKKKRTRDIHTFITSRRGVVLSSVVILFLLILAGFLRVDLKPSSVKMQDDRVEVVTAPPVAAVPLADLSEAQAFLELEKTEVVLSADRVRMLWNRIVSGQDNSAEPSSTLRQLSEYIEGIGFNNPGQIAFLAQFADKSVSVEDKARNLERYLQDNTDDTGPIVVALAHEAGEKRNHYRKALQSVLCRSGCDAFVEVASTDTLLLLVDTSGVLSEGDVERYADGLSLDESWMVLESYVKKRAKRSSSLIRSLLGRKDVSRVSALYLAPLVEDAFDSQVPTSSLIASARYGVSKDDLNQFLKWNGKGNLRVLVASLISNEEEVVALALSALASKPIDDPLLYALLQLARSANPNERAGYISLVITAGLLSVLSDEELIVFVRQASSVLTSDSKAITAIVQHGGDTLLQLVLQEHGVSIHPTVLLRMLDSESSAVRMQVLRLLQGVRVQSVRQAVLKRYFEEREVAVRQLYEQLGLLE